MDAGELISRYRQRADDAANPPFVSDALLLSFLSEAENEAAIRAKLLYDETSDFLTMEVTAGTGRVDLDPCIFEIQRAGCLLDGANRPYALRVDGHQAQDIPFMPPGRPVGLWHMNATQAVIWPTPNTDITLTLAVHRLPLSAMEDTSDEPEIPVFHREGLVDWVLYRVYSTKDIELYDERRAARALSDFEARFGPRDSADVMRRHRQRKPVVTRYGGL